MLGEPPCLLSSRLWRLQRPPPAPAQSLWDGSPSALRRDLPVSLVSRPKLGHSGAESLRPSVAGCQAGSCQEPQPNGPLSCLPHPGRRWQQPGLEGWRRGPLRPALPPACVPKHGGGLQHPRRTLPPALLSHHTHAAVATSTPSGGPGWSSCLVATGVSNDPSTGAAACPRARTTWA